MASNPYWITCFFIIFEKKVLEIQLKGYMIRLIMEDFESVSTCVMSSILK